MAKASDDGESLKRLGGGRWQTRDDRFTIEPQSGTWVVVDGEQTDDLGLPLVRGPFGSLTAAKAAIAAARTGPPATSSLPDRSAKGRPEPSPGAKGAERPSTRAKRSSQEPAPRPSPVEPPLRPEPAEPRWLADLAPDERRRARRLIDRLAAADATDPEGIARRDVVGDVPATAAWAVRRAIDSLGAEASPADVLRLLADGRDEALGVRWHLVDGDGRRLIVES